MYSQKIIEHFTKPKYVGEMDNADGVGQVGNPRCGDVMKIFIKVNNGVIKDIRFQTYGCIAAIAASDMVCELVKGKKLDDALKVTPQDVASQLGDMPPIKFHCSILGMSALKEAVDDYRKKSEK
ncbi:iron-sulfur cluster assembly scaffold protein [Candidatus Woesearchaeota archaeon]|nr:iron-sulfur cluster assembly scaffold protein [Candidatus Woesearchaeota archaeon]